MASSSCSVFIYSGLNASSKFLIVFFLKESLNLYVGLTWFAGTTETVLRCIALDLAGGLLGFTLYELCL